MSQSKGHRTDSMPSEDPESTGFKEIFSKLHNDLSSINTNVTGLLKDLDTKLQRNNDFLDFEMRQFKDAVQSLRMDCGDFQRTGTAVADAIKWSTVEQSRQTMALTNSFERIADRLRSTELALQMSQMRPFGYPAGFMHPVAAAPNPHQLAMMSSGMPCRPAGMPGIPHADVPLTAFQQGFLGRNAAIADSTASNSRLIRPSVPVLSAVASAPTAVEQKPKRTLVDESKRISESDEDHNEDYDEDEFWGCSNCGELNSIVDEICTKCGFEQGDEESTDDQSADNLIGENSPLCARSLVFDKEQKTKSFSRRSKPLLPAPVHSLTSKSNEKQPFTPSPSSSTTHATNHRNLTVLNTTTPSVPNFIFSSSSASLRMKSPFSFVSPSPAASPPSKPANSFTAFTTSQQPPQIPAKMFSFCSKPTETTNKTISNDKDELIDDRSVNHDILPCKQQTPNADRNQTKSPQLGISYKTRFSAKAKINRFCNDKMQLLCDAGFVSILTDRLGRRRLVCSNYSNTDVVDNSTSERLTYCDTFVTVDLKPVPSLDCKTCFSFTCINYAAIKDGVSEKFSVDFKATSDAEMFTSTLNGSIASGTQSIAQTISTSAQSTPLFSLPSLSPASNTSFIINPFQQQAGQGLFANKTSTTTTEQRKPLFSTNNGVEDDAEGGEDDGDDPQFKPTVEMPTSVNLVTGEEELVENFSAQAKLFRYCELPDGKFEQRAQTASSSVDVDEKPSSFNAIKDLSSVVEKLKLTVPSGAKELVDEEGWQCSVCLVNNPVSSIKCVACDSERTESNKEKETKPSSSEYASDSPKQQPHLSSNIPTPNNTKQSGLDIEPKKPSVVPMFLTSSNSVPFNFAAQSISSTTTTTSTTSITSQSFPFSKPIFGMHAVDSQSDPSAKFPLFSLPKTCDNTSMSISNKPIFGSNIFGSQHTASKSGGSESSTFLAANSRGDGENTNPDTTVSLKKSLFGQQSSGNSGKLVFSKVVSSKGQLQKDSDESGPKEELPSTENENDPYFEPSIEMPKSAVVVTGEESLSEKFSCHSKLFRYCRREDGKMGEWKERGQGTIKISVDDNKRYRVLFRRDYVHKLACNHFISSNMKLLAHQQKQNAFTWLCTDFSEDPKGKVEQFCVKFKQTEDATNFSKIFNNAIKHDADSTEPVADQ